MKTVYFILGMHRSGTSAIGGVLNHMGFYFGNYLMEPNKNNPKGYFENNHVYLLNQKIFKENNSSWNDYNFEIQSIKQHEVDKYVNQIKIIINEEFKYAEKFVIKDPRICLLFPIWEKACIELGIKIKIIIPYRNPLEVAESLRKRENYSYEYGMILWLKHFLSAEQLSRNYKRLFIGFEELIDEPIVFTKSFSKFSGIEITDKMKSNVLDFLDKDYKHFNIPLDNFTDNVPEFLKNLIDLIKNKDFKNYSSFDVCRKGFENSLELFQHKEIFQSLKKLESVESEKNILLSKLTISQDLQSNSVKLLNQKEESLSKANEVNLRNEEKIQELNLLKESEERLSKKVIQQSNEISDKNKTIDQLINEFKELKHTFNVSQKENAKLSKLTFDIKDLESSYEIQKKQLEKTELINTKLIEKIDSKSEQIGKLNNENVSIKNKLNSLEDSLYKASADIFEKNKKSIELENTLSIKSSILKDLESQQSQKNAEINKHVVNNKIYKSRLEQSETISKAQIKLITEQKLQLKNLKTGYEGLEKENAELKYNLFIQENNNEKIKFNVMSFLEFLHKHIDTRFNEMEQSFIDYETQSKNKFYISKRKLFAFLHTQKMSFKDISQLQINYKRLPLRFLENFDQEQYLDQNDDVRMAISGGMFKNAVEHFINFGYDEISSGGRYLYSSSELIKEIDYLLTNKNQDNVLHKNNFSLNQIQTNAQESSQPDVNPLNSHFALTNIDGNVKYISNQKNILICAHVAGKYLFGSERSFLDMVKAAAKNNHNVFVTLPQNQEEYIKFLKPLVTKIIIFKYNWWRKELPINLRVIEKFENVINHFKIDLVHVNTLMLREPLLAAKNQYVKSIVHVRELLNGDQTLIDVIGQSTEEVSDFVYNTSDIVLANSKATSRLFPQSSKVKIIHNTVAVEDFDFENKIEGTIKVGLISSNIPKKGIFDFVDVAQKCEHLSQVVFRLIGPETEHTLKLKEQQKKGEVPKNIEFTGYKETAMDAIKSTNIVLSLSNFTESFGRTVIEGMSASRPVVAYKWGAVAELIDNGVDGYLTEYKDTKAIAEKIESLVMNPAKIVEIGANGKIKAQVFSFQNYQLKLKNLYQNILYNQKTITTPTLTKMPNAEEKIKIGYFLWHFPVPSETFVLNELRQLKLLGYDVMVYCKQSPYPDFKPDFDIKWQRVTSPDEMALLIKKDQRDVIHSHFTYPTVTDMVWPACEKAKIDFTFIAHAQDIFRYSNEEKNRIDEIAASQFCYRVFVPSRFHLQYLIERNVPSNKIVINPNGIDPILYQTDGTNNAAKRSKRSICAIHRFTEKKGLENLILAGKDIYKDIEIHIYGYGELEQSYKNLAKNISNVTIHGGVKNRNEMLKIFSQNDFFACPSVRASDGDMDGIPTVVMEAMAAGIPVLTTNISGIPDLVVDEITGIITDSSQTSIATNINRFYDLPTSKVSAIIENANNKIVVNYNTQSLVNNLIRVWSKQTVDLIIVSWNNLPELKEVIRRLLKYTSMPSRLIICDNNSQADVKEYLSKLDLEFEQVTVIFNKENSMVGPGTNIALEESYSDFAIYVCGKEGFVFRHGWEAPLIKYMQENQEVGLAGTLGYSPTYLTGKDYPKGVSEFPKFRNKEYALNNPDRIFKHVQGGFFIVRKTMVDEIGGFSDDVPHNYTDVEFSYYVESCGWKLGSIPQMLALYNKTRPGIFSRIDESINAIHPPTLNDLEKLERITQSKTHYCNFCDWEGENFTNQDELSICPKCQSSDLDRTIIRYLAESTLTYRRLLAIAINLSNTIIPYWKKQFQGRCVSESSIFSEIKSLGQINHPDSRLQLAYLCIERDMSETEMFSLTKELNRVLGYDAELIVQFNNSQIEQNKIHKVILKSDFQLSQPIRYCSNVVKYDWNKLFVYIKQER
ncbi:MAG: glycosyltransferase [Marinicellaceae bacterium]